ncbi:hypothetical protein GC175_13740 [bacterium]|nr:hypothetical protein [bacterium]
MNSSSAPSIFGIRHHGPGSARSLRRALDTLKPDIVLVEGPPDAQSLIPWVTHAEMEPPVALLIYQSDQPQRAAFYPFAVFSPEWQALHYAAIHGVETRFMDLPVAHKFALDDAVPEDTAQVDLPLPTLSADPLAWVAQAAGYIDGERWWEHQVEQRQDSADLFAAILHLMTALRQEFDPIQPTADAVGQARSAQIGMQREASMRQAIRTAQDEGFVRIAVVCGAWHAPALQDLADAKTDTDLLKTLPAVKVRASWVPWSYGRLATRSGYGAGIESPGWYDHLWQAGERKLTPVQLTTNWLTQVAYLFRQKDLAISSAHIIEGVRLAQSLAALRQRPLPGLPELTEAVQAVFCFGEELPLQLVREQMIVGERLGAVPAEAPTVPLQLDLEKEQKRLRLPREAAQRDLDLDLRQPTDRERSHLLHRLHLLNIDWGMQGKVERARGTFREAWRLAWTPELSVAVIEASRWGNTIESAAAARARHDATTAPTLAVLTALVNRLLLANLPDALNEALHQLQDMAALTSAVDGLMEALPPLARTLRYGDVRSTDASMLENVVDGLVTRICVGLLPACSSLNSDAANAMLNRIGNTHDSIVLLQNPAHVARWQETLRRLIDQAGLHGLLAGRGCRLLLDQGVFDPGEAARRMGLALSDTADPTGAADWLEGLLRDSGALLIHDLTLWQIIDSWLTRLPRDRFTPILPLLRRTFSTFTPPERREMGRRVKDGHRPSPKTDSAETRFDVGRAEAVLPVLARLLGI